MSLPDPILPPSPRAVGSEAAGELLAQEILTNARALRAACPRAVAVAFWDFDGTLLEGDCSEGLAHGYHGLTAAGIAAGFSAAYPSAEHYPRCLDEYHRQLATLGQAAAYGFLVQCFAGADEAALLDHVRAYFATQLRPWFFPGALQLWQTLESAGVPCFVLSASAEFFVRGAAAVLGVAEDRCHGVRLAVAPDGRLTDCLLEPLTYGEGKATRMQQILASLTAARPDQEFYPIAAFGNHALTDGPLLEAVSRTRLPAGQALGVLVNGSDPIPPFRALTFSPRSTPPS